MFDKRSYFREYQKKYRLTHSRAEEQRKNVLRARLKRELARKKEPSLILDKTNKAKLPYIKLPRKDISLKYFRQNAKDEGNKRAESLVLFDSIDLFILLTLEKKEFVETYILNYSLGLSGVTLTRHTKGLLSLGFINFKKVVQAKHWFISDSGKLFLSQFGEAFKKLAYEREIKESERKERRSMLMSLLQNGINQ